MRLADSIIIPTELERARAAGELVVFAGAGVSMGAPASLPGFKDLARQIAEPSIGWQDSDADALDRYLGRAERQKGVDVQRRARMLLTVNRPHTPLHEYLLAIFGSPERVRLITTNFDPYFATAAAAVFAGARIPQYVGPALPPGKEFRGIARLHGALEQDQDRLVLTDRDFADAYMAEGWASRFLVRLFEQRTILFVGYSLTDPLMRYLLHAIPPNNRWYALWHQDEIKHGADHAIVAVPFDTTAGNDRYGDLNDGMKRWAWYVQAPASDHDRELRRLIALGPPASPLDADYIRARLSTESGRIAFWTTAKDEPWFNWIVDEDVLDGLTDSTKSNPLLALWARWSLANFCSGPRPRLLAFLRGRPLTLHPVFAAELVRHLWVTKDPIDTSVRRQLVALLVSQPPSRALDPDSWAWLIERYAKEGNSDEAFALLRAASRPQLLQLERLYIAYEEHQESTDELPSLSIAIGTWIPAEDLRRVIEKEGHALARCDAERLLALGEEQISAAYELLDLARSTNGHFDPLSYGRTSIAPSGQDAGSQGEDVFVAIMRSAIDELAEANASFLENVATRYSRSTRTLMRRLGLYAFARCNACSSDVMLERIVEGGWPRDLFLRPELYLALGTHYGRASEQARERLTSALADDSWWGSDFDDHDRHARFSLSKKLLREAPQSAVTISFADAEARAHPEWGEADRDGLLSRVEVGWGGQEPSPIDAVTMLGWKPEDALPRLRSAFSDSSGRGDSYNLSGAIQDAAKQNAAWAIELFELTLTAATEADSQIAQAVLWALRELEIDAESMLRFLAAVARDDWGQPLTHTLAMVVEHRSTKLGRLEDVRLLDAFDAVADLIFDRGKSEPPGISDAGWTERAINHPAGHAAQIWWQVANARDWAGEQFVLSIANDEKDRWRRVVSDETASGDFARPILGMATDRLSAGDFPWTSSEVFPHFDPARNPEKSAQLWDGRLMQHRWQWSSIEGLRPYLDALYAQSAELIPARSRDLGDWTAMLTADASKLGLTLTQLQIFVRAATEEARVAFADALPRHLDRLEADERVAVWRDLLRPYWRDRRTNVPIALSPAETREMINWVIALPEVADDAFEELRQSPGERLEHADHILFTWKEETSWVAAHPTVAAKLVGFLAERRSVRPWSLDDAVAVLTTAVDGRAERLVALAAAEALAEQGAQSAASLANRLRDGDA